MLRPLSLALSLLLAGSVPATASTLTLRWAVPEPVLVQGEVRRPLVTRALPLTLPDSALSELERGRVPDALERAYRQIEARPPRDVRFAREGDRWVGRAVTGWRVDRAATGERVRQALQAGRAEAQPALRLIAPARSVRWAQGQRLSHLATGSSTFTGSPDFRVHNIRVGAARLHGRWVAPGAELNFNALVGRVGAAQGFLPGFVVTGRTLSLEDGGGLCQVSTTVFRAALRAGLPITERHAHSIQVSYYGAPGLDAAVYAPTKNLRWRNDTPGPLLVQAEWDLTESRLDIHLFGRADGRRVQVFPPRVRDLVSAPPPTYLPDPALKAGEVRRVDMPAPGARVAVIREIRWPGQPIRQEVFRSAYRPWGGVFAAAPGDPRLR